MAYNRTEERKKLLQKNLSGYFAPPTIDLMFEFFSKEGNQSGSNSTFDFPADTSLDISLHKNRLIMNDGGVAKLANYGIATSGQKGKYRVEVSSLPVYPQGAEYTIDFREINFSEDEQFHFPVIDNNSVQYGMFIAKSNPNSVSDFQIGATLSDSLDALIIATQGAMIGAWEVTKIDDNRIRFKNNAILTGFGGSNYGLPETYNNLYSYFQRQSLSVFSPAVYMGININSWDSVDFTDAYGQTVNVALYPKNNDDYYPVTFGVGGYFVNTSQNLFYYNGSTYETVTEMFREENGDLFLASPSFSGNPNGANFIGNVFYSFSPSYIQNSNIECNQSENGINGDLIHDWVNALLNQSGTGILVEVENGRCNNYTVIHVLGMLGDFSSIGLNTVGYNGWTIPQNTNELCKVIRENILQNPSSIFNVSFDGSDEMVAYIEIEEKNIQNDGDCNSNLLTFDSRASIFPFNTYFNYSTITAPLIGSPSKLDSPILGFLQDVVGGIAYISDEIVNKGVVEDIDNNELTQVQLDAIKDSLNNFMYIYYVLGTDGQLKKLIFSDNENDLSLNYLYLLTLGACFLGLATANRGGEILVRRLIFVGN